MSRVRVVLTEADLQTILNALCMAQSECQSAARQFSQAASRDEQAARLAVVFGESAGQYSELADRLIDADELLFTSQLVAEQSGSPSLRVLPGSGGTRQN